MFCVFKYNFLNYLEVYSGMVCVWIQSFSSEQRLGISRNMFFRIIFGWLRLLNVFNILIYIVIIVNNFKVIENVVFVGMEIGKND